MNIAHRNDNKLSAPFVLASAITMIAVVLVTYFPALTLGYYWDDWSHMADISRLGIGEYIARVFDPLDTGLLMSFRPLQGLMYALTALAFGFNPVAFHAVNIVLHLMNALLLGVLCWQVVPKKGLAVLAGLFYATLPVNSMGVFLINAPDALATLFYLLAICFWLIYLRQGQTRWSVLTGASFVMGLLAKEFAITLPATLFLIDRLLLRGPVGWMALTKRYVILAFLSVLYIAFELFIQPMTQVFVTYRPTLGLNILTNAIPYLAWLSFPWHADPPDPRVWLPLLAVVFLAASILSRSWVMLFLGIEAVLGMLHVLVFQWQIFDSRHLYLAGIVPAVVLALLVERGLHFVARGWRVSIALLTTGALLVANIGGVSASANDYADKARAERTPFRDISRAHPTFPEDTLLYFVQTPVTTGFLSGMFTLRYGNYITVRGTESNQRANLREHKNDLLYYFDPTGKAVEVKAERDTALTGSPSLPATFEESIRLDGYELSSHSLSRGDTLVVLLYWRADKFINKDYTTFVHLLDSAGKMVAGVDSQPREGSARTSSWSPGAPLVDYVIMPIDQDIPPGPDYALEVGLYDLATMQRVSVVDDSGASLTDRVLINGFEIR